MFDEYGAGELVAVGLGLATIGLVTGVVLGKWSSAESDAISASSVARSKAIKATSHATRTEQLDSTIWLQWLSAFRAGDKAQAKFLREPFRPGLLRAHDVWVAKAVVAPDGKVISAPAATRFTEPQYVIPDAALAEGAVGGGRTSARRFAACGEQEHKVRPCRGRARAGAVLRRHRDEVPQSEDSGGARRARAHHVRVRLRAAADDAAAAVVTRRLHFPREVPSLRRRRTLLA